jgi:hypothetical protein
MDAATARRGLKGPDYQWLTYGTVDKGNEGARSVQLEGKDGAALPYGPMVNVTLQPSGISVSCRVLTGVSGDGEAEYYPFVDGDEVLVGLPEGHERAGAVILGRLNQELDAWPGVVAGQDATKNTFGFRRMRTPFVVETAASYLIRSALTGSQIGIDSLGHVIMNDGERGNLVIGAEAIGFTSGDGDTFMQMFPPSKEINLGAGGATFLLSEDESKFLSQGAISFATNGGMANGTGVTAEQVVALIINVLASLATNSSFTAGPLASGAYSAALPGSAVSAIMTIMTPVLTAMASPTPFAGPPGGNFAPFFGTVFGPAGLITAAESNPLAAVDVTGTTIGYGRSGFRL